MEAKINDLRDQIETIKAEKSRLEKQIEDKSEVIFTLFNLLYAFQISFFFIEIFVSPFVVNYFELLRIKGIMSFIVLL